MRHDVYISIAVRAAVTYIIRALPLVAFRKPIENRFFKSFLYYVPYVSLAVMTFPEILSCTGSRLAGAATFVLAVGAALLGASLPMTAAISCAAVYLINLLL